MDTDSIENRLRRLKFRAWHRGTREADYMIGGFFDTYSAGWDSAALDWFERLVEEDDVAIMAWALGTETAPESYAGPLLDALKRIDYVDIPR